VQDGAAVSVSGEGRGAGGNLTADADQILLNRGRLEATTRAGQGAKISLDNANLVLMQNQSTISAEALNNATGGNVDLQAPDGFLVAGANQNNDIVATADAGRGGNIIVNTRGLIGLEERLSRPANFTNDIDASSKNPATQGTVTITQPNLDPSQGLVELPSTVIDASNLIARTCPTGGTVASVNRLSEFVITGRGGLPPSPSDSRDDEALTGWAELEQEQITGEQTGSQTTAVQPTAVQSTEADRAIVEAQSWQRDQQGVVWLIGQMPSVTPRTPVIAPQGCHPEAEQ
jgi:large exoprotein involved in heme utilization and adhesion